MIRENPWGAVPCIHASAYIDPSAIIIGDVRIGKNVFVGPGAVLRADEKGSSIVIEAGCNVQDRVIVHSLDGTRALVKSGASLSHGCIVHGPVVIGRDCFIGFGAVVFKAKLGDNVFVQALTAVQEQDIPKSMTISRDNPAPVPAEKSHTAFAQKVTKTNLELVKGYKSLRL